MILSTPTCVVSSGPCVARCTNKQAPMNPLVHSSQVLTWMVGKMNLKSKGQALGVIAACCISLALVVFAGVVSVWA